MKIIDFELAGKKHSLLTLDDANSQQCAAEILSGNSYPFPDWTPDPKVVLDVGGHVGEFSVAAKCIWPQAEVHCFEPNPKVQGILRENASQYKFHVHETAVSDFNGPVEYRISGFGSVANSIVERPNQTGKSVTVECMDAKLFMGWKPDVIKLDCEGVELTIIQRILPDISVIGLLHVEFHTESIRRQIDDLMMPTHSLFNARIFHREQGELMYVRRDLIKND